MIRLAGPASHRQTSRARAPAAGRIGPALPWPAPDSGRAADWRSWSRPPASGGPRCSKSLACAAAYSPGAYAPPRASRSTPDQISRSADAPAECDQLVPAPFLPQVPVRLVRRPGADVSPEPRSYNKHHRVRPITRPLGSPARQADCAFQCISAKRARRHPPPTYW